MLSLSAFSDAMRLLKISNCADTTVVSRITFIAFTVLIAKTCPLLCRLSNSISFSCFFYTKSEDDNFQIAMSCYFDNFIADKNPSKQENQNQFLLEKNYSLNLFPQSFFLHTTN